MPEEVPATTPSAGTRETGVSEIHNKTSFLAEKLTDWVDAQGRVPDALNHSVAISILLLGLLIASALLYLFFRPLILKIVSRLAHKTEFTWDN